MSEKEEVEVGLFFYEKAAEVEEAEFFLLLDNFHVVLVLVEVVAVEVDGCLVSEESK